MRELKHNQDGIAAIIVTMILVLVIGLIVFSFAEVSTTNNNEVLVNQLGTQAYDAAESGINAAYQLLLSDINANPSTIPPSSDSCTGSPYYGAVGGMGNGDLTSNGAVKVTCLLVDTTPPSLQASSVPANSDLIWEVNPGSSNTINQLVLTWQGDPADGTSCNITTGNFPDYASYTDNCNVPILETDIFQDDITGSPSLTPTIFNQNTVDLYLWPESTGSSGTLSLTPSFTSYTYPTNPSYNPQIVSCDEQSGSCTETINVASTQGEVYYVKIFPLYEDAISLTLTANQMVGSTEKPTPLQGEEALIDSTAKDQTEVRRIQAYVALQSTQNNQTINNAIESTNTICKQVYVFNNTTDYSDACPYL